MIDLMKTDAFKLYPPPPIIPSTHSRFPPSSANASHFMTLLLSHYRIINFSIIDGWRRFFFTTIAFIIVVLVSRMKIYFHYSAHFFIIIESLVAPQRSEDEHKVITFNPCNFSPAINNVSKARQMTGSLRVKYSQFAYFCHFFLSII